MYYAWLLLSYHGSWSCVDIVVDLEQLIEPKNEFGILFILLARDSQKSARHSFSKIALIYLCSVFHDSDILHQSSYDVIRVKCCISIYLDARASASFSPYLLSSYQSIINSKDKTNYRPRKVKLLANSNCLMHFSIFRKWSNIEYWKGELYFQVIKC